jgi:hypothetical protein
MQMLGSRAGSGEPRGAASGEPAEPRSEAPSRPAAKKPAGKFDDMADDIPF